MTIEFLEDLKRQWMAMIDAVSDPLALINGNFEVLRQNKSYVDLAVNPSQLGITEFRGKKCYEVFAGRTSPCSNCKLVPYLKNELPVESPAALAWETSELFPDRQMEVRANQLEARPSEQLFVVQYRDVTDQRRLMEQLSQSDKLAALGKLASGVAHEINSPLAGILAFSQMVLKEMDGEDPHREDLKEIEDAARKCKVIVEGLLGFGRQDHASEMQVTDVFEAVRSTLRLASAVLRKHNIDLTTTFLEPSAWVFGNQGKLGQVFLNLVTNAIYVMKDGGSLNVLGRIFENNVQISISDSGPGIEPHIASKIFDPFFTTKPIGEGTGLGLSICYSIVKQHGGKIEVESEPGLGATFVVTLPLNKEAHP